MNKVASFKKVSIDEFKKALADNECANEMYVTLKLPKRATKGSAGYDFYAPYDFTLKQGETIKIPTGIRCEIDNGWFLGLFPRSSLGFKYRLQLDNTVGIVDSDYSHSDNEGHIFIKVTNDSKSDKELVVKQGEAFAQGILLPFGVAYDDDADGVRNGGFGSTNK